MAEKFLQSYIKILKNKKEKFKSLDRLVSFTIIL